MEIDPNDFYPEEADSKALGVLGKQQTRAKYRHEGKGPAYIKVGSRVVYKGSDVLAWLDARRVETETRTE